MDVEAITIRPGRADDVPAVLALWALARSALAVTPDRAEDLVRLVAERPGWLLVAEAQEQLVGTLIAAWDGWRGNMYRLAVDPRQRRQGIAIALVRAGEASLQGRGARRVTALVAHEDGPAGALWDAAGYPPDREIGRRVRNL